MTSPATAAPVRASWWRLAVGVIAFVLLPLLPQMRVVFPIEQTPLLLVTALAVCAIVGWRNGGRLALALIWLALAVVLLAGPAGPAGEPYNWLARGWTLLLAASFGLVSVVVATEAFFPRALSALAVATSLGFALVLVSPGGPTRVVGAMGNEFNRRNNESITDLRRRAAQPEWKAIIERAPALQQLSDENEAQLNAIPAWSTVLVPALLALESLAALGLAWALYHRMSRVSIGPQLGKIRDFRFNDQLVWGVAVGASIWLLPSFADGKNAGLNLLLFFGVLYVLRGMGILAWMARGRAMKYMLIVMAIFAWPIATALAFGLGLGDTWVDLRARLQARPL